MSDRSFKPERAALARALDLLLDTDRTGQADALAALPAALPETGAGEAEALAQLAGPVIGGARDLGAETALAHMDPPTPWVAWAATLWNAALNQNLLHPDTAPAARGIEARAVAWFAPFFGMAGGHMTPGSTLANLTAVWAAREVAGVRRVVASEAAHLSTAKAAHLLGLGFETVATDAAGRLDPGGLPGDLSDACLVLTAGTTSAGAVDPLDLERQAAWTHVDAAWAGPLRLSRRHAHRLDGIERADSVAISAHKWLFQPKESALVLFREPDRAEAAISFGGGYLAAPNVGVLGSHGAVAVALMATALAWGREGFAARIDHAMAMTERLAEWVESRPDLALFARPETGLVLWRPADGRDPDALAARMPAGSVSLATLGGQRWFRNTAANPMADVERIIAGFEAALETR